MSNQIKYMYIRHQDNPDHVFTVCYTANADTLRVGATINKVVPKEKLRLDPRLQPIVGRQTFKLLQKQFTRKYQGDQHNKKIARAIARERFEQCPITFTRYPLTPVVVNLLYGLHEFVKLGGYKHWCPTILSLYQAKTKTQVVTDENGESLAVPV